MYRRGLKERIISLVISMIMVISLVSVGPAKSVNAEQPNVVDITEFNELEGKFEGVTGAEGTAWHAGMHEVKIRLPEEYNSFPKLATAGLTEIQVVLSVQDYSDSATYNNPDTGKNNKPGDGGIQLFSYSRNGRENKMVWDNSNGWWDIGGFSNKRQISYNFSKFFSNDLLYLGFQFALLDPDTKISYTIESVKLVAGSNDWPGYDRTPIADTVKHSEFDPKPNYAKLLQESLYFFDMNMCGSDVEEKTGVLWRKNCHCDDMIYYNEKPVDVTGGYHDAGDYVKFGLPQAYAASTLGIIYREYEDDFIELGQDEHVILHLNRFADYFKRCTVMDGEGKVEAFCYQVGEGQKDHKYSPEDQDSRCDCIKFTSSDDPCTDIVAETAAALAIHSIITNDSKSLTYAKALLEYAEKYEDNFKCATTDGFYNGNSYNDDLALAAYWIYMATKDVSYRTKYLNYIEKDSDDDNVYLYNVWDGNECWDDVWPATMLALDYNRLDTLMNDRAGVRTPYGYAYITDDNYGTARYNTTLQFIALALDKHRGSDIYTAWATGQMNYLLGNNPAEKCYVIGYNDRTVEFPHHSAASGYTGEVQAKKTPAHIMLGTLVGGPQKDDTFEDDATNLQTNEVALDYQVGLVGAAVALYHVHKNDEGADNKLHSKAYLKSFEISKYYGNGKDDPYHAHNLEHFEAKDATCTEDGNVEYWYCDRCEKYFADEDCTEELDEDEIFEKATDHEWNDPTYTWADDNSTVTATRVCKNNSEHIESETVSATYEVIKEAGDKEEGAGKYTSGKFKNEAFEIQTKEVVIPVSDKPSEQTDPVQQNEPVQKDEPVQQNEPVQKDDPVQQDEPEQKAEDGTDVGPGASETVADKAITTCDNDEGPAGSTFGILQAKMKKVSKDSITISWNKISGAKYIVYGNQCGNAKKFEKLAEVNTNKYTQKKLKKGTHYKYLVVAVKDGKVVSTSKTLHIVTKGGKFENYSKVKLNKKSITLKVKKTFKLKAKLVTKNKKSKVKNHRKVKYESSDTTVVTVNSGGKIKAVGKGTAIIYAYAQDGVMAKVKVKVK